MSECQQPNTRATQLPIFVPIDDLFTGRVRLTMVSSAACITLTSFESVPKNRLHKHNAQSWTAEGQDIGDFRLPIADLAKCRRTLVCRA